MASSSYASCLWLPSVRINVVHHHTQLRSSTLKLYYIRVLKKGSHKYSFHLPIPQQYKVLIMVSTLGTVPQRMSTLVFVCLRQGYSLARNYWAKLASQGDPEIYRPIAPQQRDSKHMQPHSSSKTNQQHGFIQLLVFKWQELCLLSHLPSPNWFCKSFAWY